MSDGTVAHRVLALPELLRNVLFSLPKHRDTYHAALVCRTWSECALDVLWYQVEEICILFNLLVPLTHAATSPNSKREFVRGPRPQDWVNFERYSKRVKRLVISGTSELPAESVFDDITRSRIQQTILPNLWSLYWAFNPFYCVAFLHSGIQNLALRIDVNLPAQMEVFMQNARFFCRNVVILEIDTGFDDDIDPHPVGCVVSELSDWLVQLHNLREVILPRFWITTRVFQVLSQLNQLTRVGLKYDNGFGNPLDTMAFNPILDSGNIPGPFPSLLKLSQSAPFSKMIPFITSWQGSSRITYLAIESQILESPNSFRSILNVIGDSCPRLSHLVLTCLITPYRHHPQGFIPSEARVTLDTLRSLHKLTHLEFLEIAHTLPLALTNDDFLLFTRKLPNIKMLLLGANAWPFDPDDMHTIEAPLSSLTLGQAATTTYPIPGLYKSIKSLRRHCPQLRYIAIFGIDDFNSENDSDQVNGSRIEDEPEPLPFPDLAKLSFGTSLMTSDNALIAFALSQYVLPGVKFAPDQWARGGDEASEYLTYLNLKPLIPIRDELTPALQRLIDSADSDLPNAASANAFSTMVVDEPVGIGGVVDDDMETKLQDRAKPIAEIDRLLNLMARARLDERERAERRLKKAC